MKHIQLVNSFDEWFTPPKYITSARKVQGIIDLDPASCAEANKIIQATRFYTEVDDGLSKPWTGRVFLNPPFSKAGKFVSKLVECFKAGDVIEAILLCSSNASTANWFQPLFSYSICFHRRRIKFIDSRTMTVKGANSTGSLFVYLGQNVDRFVNEFSQYGPTCKAGSFVNT